MKILYTIFFVFTTTLSVSAGTQKTIRIENLRTNLTGETLDISFGIQASGLDTKCDGQMTIEFAVENSDRRLVLPVVIYSGKQRYRYEQRREVLSDAYHIEPYHIYKGVKKEHTYKLEYKLSIPYYTWMEHASITYREYVHDCSGDRCVSDGTLLADLNPEPEYVEPEVWTPKAEYFPNLVCFQDPEVETEKARASVLELYVNFPVNITEVRPSYMDNPKELARADSLVRALDKQSDLITIGGVIIKGYASPEGSYAANERLARGRSQSFKQYLINKYPYNGYLRNATTLWVPEDWEGLGKLVDACGDVTQKQDVLAIICDNGIAPDAKDRMLQNIMWWSDNYKVILRELYPKLRRIELRVDYTVRNLTDSEARELLYTNPDMLSLDEIYRVARYYEHGSRQYREVYEIAARQYPRDVIANNNAAAALLQEGKAEEALPYLEKTKEDKYSLINYGAYYYISGDLEKAAEYLSKAKAAGIEQAEQNLKLIMN